MRAGYLLPVLGVVTCLAAQVHAGFVTLEYDVSEATATHTGWGTNLTPNSSTYDAKAWENVNFSQDLPDTQVISGTIANSDPTLFVTESITNTTTNPWYGNTLDCSGTGGVSFVLPLLTSASPFTEASFSGSHIDFEAPGGPILPTQVFTVNFFVDVASTTDFSLTLVQTPVLAPEPASLGLLAIGGLALLRRRR